MSMDIETEYFLSQDGLRLYYRHWPATSPQNILCIVHGLAEHGGRYEHVAEFLNAHQISVFAIDLRGHGLSEGKRGHTKSYELLLSDVEEFLKVARAEYTDLPLFLLGHSMGGNIVASYMLKMNINEIKGFVLSSPWLKLAFTPPAWKINLAKTMASVWPSLTQPDGLSAEDLSHDKAVVKAYQNDPLVHGMISVKLYLECTKAAEELLIRSGEIKKTGLCFHGTEDAVISEKATAEFASSNNLLTYKAWPGNFHENLNELNKEEVMKYLSDWITSWS